MPWPSQVYVFSGSSAYMKRIPYKRKHVMKAFCIVRARLLTLEAFNSTYPQTISMLETNLCNPEVYSL